MPVMNRTWTENEIQISDLVRGEMKRTGLSIDRVTALAKDYLNEPEAWTQHADWPETLTCSFLAPNGQRATVALSIATLGSLAVVSHIDVQGDLESLGSTPQRIAPEFEEHDVAGDYVSKPPEALRAAKVKFEKRGKTPPMQFVPED